LNSLVHIKWNKPDDHSEALLRSIVLQYGTIQSFIMKPEGTSALVQYADSKLAARAVRELAKNNTYRFTVSLGSGKKVNFEEESTTYFAAKNSPSYRTSQAEMLSTHTDFEAQILAKMMQFQQNLEAETNQTTEQTSSVLEQPKSPNTGNQKQPVIEIPD